MNDRRHRCRECGWPHYSGETQADRVVSIILLATLAILFLTMAGCAYRPGSDAAQERGMARVMNSPAIQAEDCGRWP